MNLTSSLTLDGTVNPDFGQVEVDPAVVNLSVFETTFSEKRPFFVSNSQYFSFGGFSCYFCNNVSSLNLDLHPPDRTLATARRSCRQTLGSSWMRRCDDDTRRAKGHRSHKVGHHRRTARRSDKSRDDAKFRLDPTGVDQEQEVEPLANYFIGRARKDFRGGATRIGAITHSRESKSLERR